MWCWSYCVGQCWCHRWWAILCCQLLWCQTGQWRNHQEHHLKSDKMATEHLWGFIQFWYRCKLESGFNVLPNVVPTAVAVAKGYEYGSAITKFCRQKNKEQISIHVHNGNQITQSKLSAYHKVVSDTADVWVARTELVAARWCHTSGGCLDQVGAVFGCWSSTGQRNYANISLVFTIISTYTERKH